MHAHPSSHSHDWRSNNFNNLSSVPYSSRLHASAAGSSSSGMPASERGGSVRPRKAASSSSLVSGTKSQSPTSGSAVGATSPSDPALKAAINIRPATSKTASPTHSPSPTRVSSRTDSSSPPDTATADSLAFPPRRSESSERRVDGRWWGGSGSSRQGGGGKERRSWVAKSMSLTKSRSRSGMSDLPPFPRLDLGSKYRSGMAAGGAAGGGGFSFPLNRISSSGTGSLQRRMKVAAWGLLLSAMVAIAIINLLWMDSLKQGGDLQLANAGTGRPQLAIADGIDSDWLGQPFQLNIHLVTSCSVRRLRMTLQRLLRSVDFDGDNAALTIIINCNNSTLRAHVSAEAFSFRWRIGRFQVRIAPPNKYGPGNGGRVASSFSQLMFWWPSALQQYALVLSDTAVVSPLIYKYTKATVEAYLNFRSEGDPMLFGMDLLDVNRPPKADDSPELKSKMALRQRMTADCQLMFPQPWREFRNWNSKFANFTADAFELTKRKQRGVRVLDFNHACSHNLLSNYIAFAHNRGLFNLFVGSVAGKSLCVTAQSAQAGGSEAAAITSGDADDTKLSGEEFEEQFEAEGSMGKLLKAKDVDLASNKMLTSEQLMVLHRSDLCGSTVASGMFAENQQQLKNLLQSIHEDHSVIAVMTSAGFEEMLENWLCFVKEMRLKNYFVITTSRSQAVSLVQRGHSALFLKLDGGRKTRSNATNGMSSLDYGTVEYKQFILQRTKWALQILKLGYSLLLADVDAVWLSNPMPYFRNQSVDLFAQLEPSGHLCGGFLYLRSNTRVIKMWTQITRQYDRTVARMVKEYSSKKPHEMEAWLKGFEHLHEQRYLNQYVRAKDNDVIVEGLSMNLFPNGRDYFVRRKPQHANIDPIVIHNNYIKGKANKTRRFKEHGLWRLDPSNRWCACLVCRHATQRKAIS